MIEPIYLENNQKALPKSKTKCYENLDIAKYIASFLVIVIHTAPLLEQSKLLNYGLMNVIARVAVPFFFVSSAFFFRKGVYRDKTYFRKYMHSTVKSYLIWSLIYLPIGMEWIATNLDLPIYLYPIALIAGVFYVGVYYHLWYIPALIFSLVVVHWLLNRFSYKVVFTLSGVLYGFGCLETYYGVIQNKLILAGIDQYMHILGTTRNGLFLGLIFITIGFFMSDFEAKLSQYRYGWLLLICGGLVALEAAYLYKQTRLDMNFLVMLVPLSFVLFQFLLQQSIDWSFSIAELRETSKYYYFSHGIFLFWFPFIFSLFGLDWIWEGNGILRFLLVLACTHCTSIFLVYIKKLSLILTEVSLG
ncbi:acyltransferase family protein [Carnobacterium gallinarum]|uniref:acyltransferase family protein n=1 Tax=Carnobacterium gallinarum TaxID=2749 RepID=UPI00068F4B26|nr:acyltransferase family protein [Carnobacterium gallinarum]